MLGMARKTTEARWRLSARTASRRLWPSPCLRARYSRAGGFQRPWLTAMRCRAALSCRLPWRFKRWRWRAPEEASRGATPACMANLAALGKRAASPTSPSSLAAVSGPQPGMARSGPGALSDRPGDLLLQGVDLGPQGLGPPQELARDPHLHPAPAGQPLPDLPPPRAPHERRRRDRLEEPQLVQVPAKALVHAPPLGHQVLAVVDQEPELALGPAQAGAGEPRLLQDRPGHGQGVGGIRLAAPPGAPAKGGHHLRGHPHHLLPAPEEQALQVAGDVAAVLEGERTPPPQPPRPGEQARVPLPGCRHGVLAQQLTGARLHRAGGVGALVRVHPDHDHLDLLGRSLDFSVTVGG